MAVRNFEEVLQQALSSSLNVIVGYLCVESLGLNVCECTGKAERHSGRRVSSHSCLAKGTVES